MSSSKFVTSSVSLLLLGVLAGCSSQGTQDDSRYGDNFDAPNTEEAYDGANIDLPENYTPAYDAQSENSEITMAKIDETVELGGAKYTVRTPSKVHASTSVEGFDSFLVDLEIDGDEEHPTGDAAGVSYFVYAPSGLYATDLKEMRRQQELDERRLEYEEKGEELPADFYDDYMEQPPLSYTKTFEIPYDGDGTYTLEIRDFVNSRAYRIPMTIVLES